MTAASFLGQWEPRMFDRFTDRAKHVILLAGKAALSRRHGRVGTEHILLDLIDEPRGMAAHALRSLGVSL